MCGLIFDPFLFFCCKVSGWSLFFPHIFVWGSCFWFCTPASGPPPPPASSSYNLPSHNLSTHNLLTHNLSTHNLLTHNFSTHTTCSHTTCSHTTCHTQLVNTQLVLTQLVNTQLVNTQLVLTQLVHTQLPHTQLVHTQLVHLHNLSTHNLSTFTLRGRRGTWWQPPSVCVAGVALGDIHLHFAWQARHLATSTVTLRGRRGTWVAGVALMALGWLWWRAWFPDDAVDAAALCVAGVALGDMDVHPAWQAWDLVTSTFVSGGGRGASGTSGTGLVLVARLSTHTLSTHNLSQLVHTQLVDIHLLHMPILHHLFSLSRISHPIFTFLLPVIGRSWHVGLSGPLIFQDFFWSWT